MSLLSSQEILALNFNAVSDEAQRRMIFNLFQQIAARLAHMDEQTNGGDQWDCVTRQIDHRSEELSAKKGS